MSKLGATQEHVMKALDIKSSIETTVCRMRKMNIAGGTDSQQTVASASQDTGECYM